MTLPRAIITALIACALVLWWTLGFEPEQPPSSFEPKLVERVVLPLPEHGEAMRVDEYAPDGFTKVKTKVTFTDGSTGYANYRPDGTVSTFGVYFPSDDVTKQVKMEGEYEEDGVHLSFEKHFREDGTMHREGFRVASGNYVVKTFFEGKAQVASSQVFDEDGDLETYEKWYANGRMKESLALSKGAKITKKFDDNGALRSFHRNHYSGEVWENYQPDGETLITRFSMESESDMDSTIYYVLAEYFNEDGSLNHERKFYRDRMMVIFKDAEGKMVFQQRWKHLNWGAGELTLTQDQYLLTSIELDNQAWSKEGFWFFDDGKTIRRSTKPVQFPVPYGRRTSSKNYDQETGKLVETRVPDLVDGSIKFKTTKFELSDSPEVFDYGQLKPEWLEVYPYTLPPKVPLESEYSDE